MLILSLYFDFISLFVFLLSIGFVVHANVKERKADVDVLFTHSSIVNKMRDQSKQHEASIEKFRERLTEVQTEHSTNLPELQKLEQDAQKSQEVASQITHYEGMHTDEKFQKR